MKPIRTGLLLAIGLAVLAAMPMADVLMQPGAVLAFNDGGIEVGLSPIYHFPAALLRIWDNQFFFGSGQKQHWLSVHALNESLSGAYEARRFGVVAILVCCGLAWYWSLRQFRVRRGVAAFAAGASMLSGLSFSFAVAGLYVRPIAVAFCALAVGLAERGRLRNGWLDFVLAGGCIGLAVSEVPDVGAFCAMTAGIMIGCRHLAVCGWSGRSILTLAMRGALIVAMAILLAWQTLVNVSSTTIQGVKQGESDSDRYAWATQWSIPPVETWDIVAGSYFGTTMANPDLPYWGGIGRSEGWERTHQGYRNFRMSAWYAGVLPSILLLTLLPYAWRRRASAAAQADPLPAGDRGLVRLILGGCLLTLLLSWGKHFPLYRLVWSLPYFGTVRNPDKWNAPFMLFMTLGVGIALDALLATLQAPVGAKGRAPAARPMRSVYVATGVIGGLALVLLVSSLLDRARLVGDLGAQGYGSAAAPLWSHSIWICVKVLALCTAFVLAIAWARRRAAAKALLAAVALLTAADLVETSRYFADAHMYNLSVASNALTSFLDQHAREGRILLLPPPVSNDPSDPNRAQAAGLGQALNQMRSTLLMARGYDVFNPISVSRMPTDYESLFGAVGYTSPRLLELGSIRWIVTVPGIEAALNHMDGDCGRFVERLALGLTVRDGAVIPVDEGPPAQRALRVVEFTGALPVFQPISRWEAAGPGVDGESATLARLASRDFNPRQVAVVHAAPVPPDLPMAAAVRVEVLRELPAETEIHVSTPQPAVLVRSVKYDADWVIRGGEGAPQHPLRVNYMFQGIPVPAGEHTLTLTYAPPRTAIIVAAGGRSLLLLLAIGAVVFGRKHEKGPAVAGPRPPEARSQRPSN